MTKDKTVKINIGYWFHLDGAERFCQEHFGPGGDQADRRWFYRLLDLKRPRGNFGYPKFGNEDLVLYFRHPQDAMWFILKFKSEFKAVICE